MKNSSFSKNILSVFTTKIIFGILKIAISALIARTLGVAGKGIYVSFMAFISSIVGLGSLGLTESTTYFIANKRIKSTNYFSVLITNSIILSCGMIAIILIIKQPVQNYIFKDFPVEYYNFTFLFIFFMVTNNLFASFLKGLQDFYYFNLLTIIISLLNLLFIASAFFFFQNNVTVLILTSLLISVINFLIACFYLIKNSNIKIIFNKKLFSQMFSYGIMSHVGNITNNLENQFDIFIMLFFMNPEAVGIFSIAYATGGLIGYISNSLNNVLFPIISSLDKNEKAVNFQNKTIRHNLLFNILGGLFLIIIGYPFIKTIFGVEFIFAYTIMLIILPGIIFDSVYRTIFSWYKGIGEPKIVSYFSAAGLIINIILNIILIPIWGLYGAGLAVLISYIIKSTILILFYRKNYNLLLSDFLLIRKVEIVNLKTRLLAIL